MLSLPSLFALALLGTTLLVSAVHIDFKRYADDACDAGHHIRKTTDLHDTHCKSFSHHEVGFHSFSFKITDDHEDVHKKDCRVVVFAEKECKGEGVTYGDMKHMEQACAKIPIEGHSVRLECGKKKAPEVKVLAPMPKPQPTTHTHKHKATATVTVTHEPARSTVTVVPKKHRDNSKMVCHYENPDDWE